MKLTKEEFFKDQMDKLDKRSDEQKKFDLEYITNILSKLQGK